MADSHPKPAAYATFTPLANRIASERLSHPKSPDTAMENRPKQARVMRGRFAGPMPVSSFFDEFFPSPSEEAEYVKSNSDDFDFSKVNLEELKKDKKTIAVLVDLANVLMLNAKLVDTQHQQNISDYNDPYPNLRADASGYDRDLPTDGKGKANQHDHLKWWLELKPDESEDPLRDPAPSDTSCPYKDWEPSGAAHTKSRGQSCAIFDLISAKQFRTWVFSVYLEETGYGRFFCWDHEGAIVTERFQWNVADSPLAKFFYCVSRMTNPQLGIDTTVSKPTLEEVKEASPVLAHFREFPYVYDDDVPDEDRLTPDESYIPSEDVGNYIAIAVPQEREGMRRVIAEKPDVRVQSPIGRSARCTVVYDLQDKRVYFLKDNWRATGLEFEGDFLEELKSKDVPNVPTYVCGGSLPGQATRTDRFWDKPWNVGRGLYFDSLDSRRHQRFLMKEYGISLHKFACSKDAFTAIHDAAEAHRHAWIHGILHRDISAGNILIVLRRDKTGKVRISGLLIDWDLARRHTDTEARQKERTGTWPFMSVKMLRGSFRPQDVTDDLESFFWVSFYVCVRYMPFQTEWDQPELMEEIFFRVAEQVRHFRWNDKAVKMHVQVGGVGKERLLTNAEAFLGSTWEIIGRPDLKAWIEDNFQEANKLLQWNLRQDARFREEHAKEIYDALSASRPLAVPLEEPQVQEFRFGSHDKFIANLRELLDKKNWPTHDLAKDCYDLPAARPLLRYLPTAVLNGDVSESAIIGLLPPIQPKLPSTPKVSKKAGRLSKRKADEDDEEYTEGDSKRSKSSHESSLEIAYGKQPRRESKRETRVISYRDLEDDEMDAFDDE